MKWLVAQVPDPSGWTQLLETYGPFAPFAMLLLWTSYLLWKDGKEKDAEIRRLTEAAMDKVIPLVLEATNVLADAVNALHEVKDRQEDITRMNILMNDLKDAVEDLQEVIEDVIPRRKPGK